MRLIPRFIGVVSLLRQSLLRHLLLRHSLILRPCIPDCIIISYLITTPNNYRIIARSGYWKYDHECRKTHQIKRLSSFCYMLIVGNRVFQCVFLGLVLNLSHYVYMWSGATCRTHSSGHLSMLKIAGWLFSIYRLNFAGSLSHGHLFHISVFSYFTNIKLDKRFRFKMDFFPFLRSKTTYVYCIIKFSN